MKFSALLSIAGLIAIAILTPTRAEEVATGGAESLRLPDDNNQITVEQNAERLQEIEAQINGGKVTPVSPNETRIRPIGDVEGLDVPEGAVFINGTNGDALGIEIR